MHLVSGDIPVAALLLAAGSSRRMGRPKQLLPWRGSTLVRHAAETALASRATPLIVVVGSAAEGVRAALAGLDSSRLEIVGNPEFASGQASSLRVGIDALPVAAQAALVMLVDQPLVQPALLNALIDVWAATQAPLVVPRHGGRRGNPVLIARSLFHELRSLTGDTGARPLFERYADAIAWVEADESVLIDLDSPEAYARFQ